MSLSLNSLTYLLTNNPIMNLTEFLSQGLSLTGTFNPKIAALLFLLCLIGEVSGLFVPYLLETTWLLVGYQFSSGALSIFDLVLLALMAQAGRQIGTLGLYHIGRSSSSILTRYTSYFRRKIDANGAIPYKLFSKINSISPFSVAVGRLLWLRIPLTLILGAERKLKVLLLGVSLSSLVYDGTYIALGAIVGTTTALAPIRLIPYLLVGLTVMYGITFVIRRLISTIAKRQRLKDVSN